MLIIKVLCVLVFVGTHVKASENLTNKLIDQFKSFKSEMTHMLYMAGYHQGRTLEKLDRIIGNDRKVGTQHNLLSRLDTVENYVKEYKKEKDRKYHEMNEKILGINKKVDTQQREYRALEKLVKKNKDESDRKYMETKADNSTVAFTVSSTNLENHNNQKIKYDKVITNIGNAYDNNTGIFTCPVNGIYIFTWSTMSRLPSQSCFAFIYLNGSKLMMTSSFERGSHDEVASNTMVLSLNVNDHVWIGTTTGSFCYGYPYTGFSGWKL